MSRTLRVAAVSPPIRTGALDANLATIERAVMDAAAAGAALIVLPELATSGYSLASPDEARAAALHGEDERLAALGRDLPDGAVAVIGFAELAEDSLANSAAVLTADGVLGVYRKVHLWGDEPDLWMPGAAAAPVLETPVGRLGVAICYDNEFPEVPRALALQGAEVLALPSNWPLVPRPAGERAPEVVQAMAAARSSRLPVVVADRHGSERGVEWTGGSCIVSAEGWVVAASPAGPLHAEVEIPGDRRLGPRNDALADRRPEHYR
ncbi:nitrilase-related carbon-nitrogen hydrolase [Homoserinibacter sp. YIM 151385]|uniref:nitrilase-related carbon-nitrogen hydrolase n=1 Tax=Homoserinibacter sp. YIM 151385 TaxID=2985506 RepID=UPI0022F03E73|nr:nitrilase-related carbon-nitrogen hydrolase [Homoserinibacter sp. YIM 151385]WBU38537.1 carbon-nitrogen hydrolase [Homoserinibacter sp. YIM 151385]